MEIRQLLTEAGRLQQAIWLAEDCRRLAVQSGCNGRLTGELRLLRDILCRTRLRLIQAALIELLWQFQSLSPPSPERTRAQELLWLLAALAK
ncbi:MAG: hypothetical protein ABIK43_06855 [candidate division WOR-3 bacterium]